MIALKGIRRYGHRIGWMTRQLQRKNKNGSAHDLDSCDNRPANGAQFTVAEAPRFEGLAVSNLVDEGFAGYCEMAAGPDGTVYLACTGSSKRGYDRVAVVRFNLEWLAETDSRPNGKAAASTR